MHKIEIEGLNMVKRNAVYSAVINDCKGYEYEIKDSKSTNTMLLERFERKKITEKEIIKD